MNYESCLRIITDNRMERCNKKYRRKLIGEWKEEWKKKEDKRIEKKVYTRAKNTKLD